MRINTTSFQMQKSQSEVKDVAITTPPVEIQNPSTSQLTTRQQLKRSASRLRDATTSQTAQDRFILSGAWVIIYIGVMLCLAFQLLSLTGKYYDYPTDIHIEIVTKSELEFPAVTVCNENPLRKSLVGRIRNLDDFELLDKYVMSSVKSFATEAFQSVKSVNCEKEMHTCVTSRTCVPQRWICNGVINCEDGSDEDEARYNCSDIFLKRSKYLTAAQGICNWPFIQCPNEQFCARPCSIERDCGYQIDNIEELESECRKRNCNFRLQALRVAQEFTSPNYPDNYDPDLNCIWTITARRTMKIRLNITDIEIEGHPGGCQDYLQFFDGSDQNSGRLVKVDGHGKVCGYQVPTTAVLNSESANVTVKFFTNALLNTKGFKIRYTAVPRRNNGQTEAENGQGRNRSRTRRNAAEKSYHASNRNQISKTGGKNSNSETGSAFDKQFDRSELSDRSNYNTDSENRETIFVTGLETGESELLSGYEYPDGDISFEETTENMATTDVADQFYSVKPNDYFGLYKASELPDYSDFRLAAFFAKGVIASNGYQKHDFIVQCTYDGKPCDASYFNTFQDPFYGNCFSFNSVRGQNTSKPWKIRPSSKTGQEFGLKLTLFLDISEYIGLLGPTASVRAMVHASRLRPLVRAQSFAVGAGEVTYISLRLNQIIREVNQYSNCTNDWPRFLQLSRNFTKQWKNYDKDNCLYFCAKIVMAKKCDCTDSYEFGFSNDPVVNEASKHNCDLRNQKQSECRQNVYQEFKNNKIVCDCPNECLKVGFTQRQSSAPWPTEAYAPYFASKMLQSDSERVINYMQELLTENEVSAKNFKTNFSENFARLEVFYETLNFERISESRSYDTVDLLSDFGGNLGLWLGWSVLIIFEVIQFLFECICIIVKSIFISNR